MKLTQLSLALTLLLPSLRAQTCRLVKDVNAVPIGRSSDPEPRRMDGGTGFLKCGSYWFFTAQTAANGRELWRTDGTAAGTLMLRDIVAGSGSSDPRDLICCDLGGGRHLLFFRARSSANGSELWRSDGTTAGTWLVRDILPGFGSAFPQYFACLKGKVYFGAAAATLGNELWSSDGTRGGTTLVKDFPASADPRYLITNPAGTAILYRANFAGQGIELFRTDGTAAGTGLLKDIRPGRNSSGAFRFENLGAVTLFSAADGVNGSELWSTDGTSAGTKLVKDLWPGARGSSPRPSEGAVLGTRLFFPAVGLNIGNELWVTDGTAGGTSLAKDIRPGPFASDITGLFSTGTSVLFAADDGTRGVELWQAQPGRTVLLKDIAPGPADSSPRDFVELGSKTLFGAAGDLWETDETAAGTKRVLDSGRVLSPEHLTSGPGGRVLFAGCSLRFGCELWSTDGTAAGTRLVKDLDTSAQAPGDALDTDAGEVHVACAFGSALYFGANDGTRGVEPWIHTKSGTSLLADVRPGAGSSAPSEFTPVWVDTRALTFFVADDGTNGRELWRTDGTQAGTGLVKNIGPGVAGDVSLLVAFQNRVYFRAVDASGAALWVSDGTPAGTTKVRDLAPNDTTDRILEIFVWKDRLLISGGGAAAGVELWISDGTGAGTRRLKDVNPGAASSSPAAFAVCGSRVAFFADDGTHGIELWSTDGTAAGTSLVKDVRFGSPGSVVTPDIVSCGDRVFFRADDFVAGAEVWTSDLTAAGTKLVRDIVPGRGRSLPSSFVCCGGRVFFIATDLRVGTEVWTTDGTVAGTVPVKDIRRGRASSEPAHLTCVGNRVWFSARASSGNELWCSDGTDAGTVQVCDVDPGFRSSSPSNLTVCCGVLYFAATTLASGRELWSLTLPGAVTETVAAGCPPHFPVLAAGVPELGKSVALSGSCAPSPAIGILALSGPTPFLFQLPISSDCVTTVNLFTTVLLGIPQTPSWSVHLPLPNDDGLRGVKLALQAVYASTRALFSSNGVLLTLGR